MSRTPHSGFITCDSRGPEQANGFGDQEGDYRKPVGIGMLSRGNEYLIKR